MSKNRKPTKSPQIEEDDNDDDEVLRQKLLENLVKSQVNIFLNLNYFFIFIKRLENN